MISAYFAAVAPFVLICTESCFEFTATLICVSDLLLLHGNSSRASWVCDYCLSGAKLKKISQRHFGY